MLRVSFAPGTVVGLAGTTLLGLGAFGLKSFHPDGWGWAPARAVSALTSPLSSGLMATGACALIVGWWMLRPRRCVAAPPVAGVLTLWSLPLLLVPPLLSADAFAYAELGWILHQGANPGSVSMGSLGGPFAASVDPLWVGRVLDYYPPLSLLANQAGIELGGLHPYWGVIGQRVVALAGLVPAVVFLPRLATALGVRQDWALWLGILNPLLIIHGVGGAHVDLVMVGLVVVGLWLATRTLPLVSAGLIVAPVLIGLAMMVKPYAGLAVVGVAGVSVLARLTTAGPWQRAWLLGWRTAVATLVTLCTAVVVSWGSGLGLGWMRAAGSGDGRLVTYAPSMIVTRLIHWVVARSGNDPAWVEGAVWLGTVAVAIALFGWLFLTKAADPVAVNAWGSLLVLLASPALLPWYLLLSLGLLALTRLTEGTARLVVWVTSGYTLATVFSNHAWLGLVLGAVGALDFWFLHRAVGRNEPFLWWQGERREPAHFSG